MTGRRVAGWRQVLAEHELADRATSPAFWEAYLGANPDMLHRILADLYRATYGVERTPSIDELWDLVSGPKFSNKPFGEALYDILAGRSLREIARNAGLHFENLRRYVTGARPIVSQHDVEGSMRRLEIVAEAAGVHPSYFAEWRRLWIMMLIDAAFSKRPELSVALFRRLSGLDRAEGVRRNARYQVDDSESGS